jgi:hypothetical protein
VGDEVMTNFILGALPWVAFAITVALVLNNSSKKKKSNDNFKDINTVNKKENNEKEGNGYISIGMSLGMLFGVAIGSAFMNIFGGISITYGICFGMLGGKLAEMYVRKK